MKKLHQIAASVCVAWLMTATSPSAALTIVASLPHDPKVVCGAAKAFFGGIRQGRHQSRVSMIYTDRFGLVDADEWDAFAHDMAYANGKPDKAPIRVRAIYPLIRDRFNPAYIVMTDRWSWHKAQSDDDGVGQSVPEGYSTDYDYWLVKFASDDISEVREAFWLYRLTNSRKAIACD